MKDKNTLVTIFRILLFLYVCSLGFQTLFDLPYFGKKFQLPEFFFLVTFGFSLIVLLRKPEFFKLQITVFDGVIFLFPLTVFISTLANGGGHTWLEFVGVVYLFATYFLFKTILSKFTTSQIYDLFYGVFLWGGLLLAISCWIGWGMLYFFDQPNNLVFIYEKYPYFGDIIRVEGFLPSPHMAANIFNISIVFFCSKILFKKSIKPLEFILIGVILFAYILTFAKVVILLLLSLAYIFYKKNKTRISKVQKGLFSSFMGITILFYLFAVHFMIVKKQNLEGGKIKAEHFNVGYSIAENDTYLLVPTTYFALKKSAFLLGKANPIFGVGMGNHEFRLEGLRASGDFPKYLENYPPHSTYFGGFAELGIVGLGGILFIFISIWKELNKLIKKRMESPLLYVFFAIFFIAGLESISTDILNFRQYWILLAIFSAILDSKKF